MHLQTVYTQIRLLLLDLQQSDGSLQCFANEVVSSQKVPLLRRYSFFLGFGLTVLQDYFTHLKPSQSGRWQTWVSKINHLSIYKYSTMVQNIRLQYGVLLQMGVSNPRDDRAEWKPRHSQPKGWKCPSTTEPHNGFFFLHNTTEKLPFTLSKAVQAVE